MIRRVLIANRGEIAVRIIRACRETGVEPVAVYSTADETAMHREFASRAVCVGAPRAADSYLRMDNIVSAALATQCDAVHPGFGFLSENSAFARLCADHGLAFIGPSPEVIDCMGNKALARSLMQKAGVPVVPGSDGSVDTVEKAQEIAEKIGYPVLVKAAAGGGGRGMRKVPCKQALAEAFRTARAEAEACFGDRTMYLEKLILNPRHIEVQILADAHGNTVHLGERDCSMQRRNQKLLEEAPAIGLSVALRDEICSAAVRAAQAAGYQNAGTVEFVLDKMGRYYFIEMNTRIQVEHPVTELLTGIDIVREQLRIASGLPLSFSQKQVHFSGHALECRINAEDPERDFAPCPGKIDFLHFPAGPGVRVDSALYNGCEISPYYDSMVAKIIVHGDTRLEAVRRMRRALEEMVVEGVTTNLSLQHLILFEPQFLRGEYDTGFLENHLAELMAAQKSVRGAL